MPGGMQTVNEIFEGGTVGPRWVRLIQGYGEQHLSDGRLRLGMRPGPAQPYTLSQLDDYHNKGRRSDYPWTPPLRLMVRARFSANDSMVGTAGFGFWNAPFTGERLSRGGSMPPQATWFFYASPPNQLAFGEEWSGRGFFVQSVRSPKMPGVIASLGTKAMRVPLLGRLASWVGTGMIPAAGKQLDLDRTEWHTYRLYWEQDETRFEVDGDEVFTTPVSPHAPLGFAVWIDNQYASIGAGSGLDAGLLPIPDENWLDLTEIRIEPQ